MRTRLLLAAVICLFAACFHRIYDDHHYCYMDDDCTLPGLPYCYAGICTATMPPDGGFGDMPPKACKASKDCTVPTQPICDTTAGLCRPCASEPAQSQDCLGLSAALPFCASDGACVECRSSDDCISKNQACKASQCKPCVVNDDCSSGLCQAGACANPSDQVYVKQACPSPPGMGTYADPFCTIADGVAQGASAGKPVVVLPGSYTENLTLQPSGATYNVRIIGIGMPTVAGAPGAPVFLVKNASAKVNVSLEGLRIQTGTNGVECGSLASAIGDTHLKVMRSEILNNSGLGVTATKCDVLIDQTKIGPTNMGGGVALTNSDFLVQNTTIFKNGSSTSGVGGMQFGGTFAKGVVVNDTLYQNTAQTGATVASGLSCGGTNGTYSVFNVVVYKNTGGIMVGIEVNSLCNADHSAFVGATGTNQDLITCNPNQLFVDAATNDFHVKASGAAPCWLVDLGASTLATINAPTYDLDGNPRPKGGGFDIGAYEVP